MRDSKAFILLLDALEPIIRIGVPLQKNAKLGIDSGGLVLELDSDQIDIDSSGQNWQATSLDERASSLKTISLTNK